MIIINAKIKVDENKREDYLQLMADLVEHSRQEKGNLFYHHYEDVSEANTFVVVENYKDENAVEEHNQSEHFQTICSAWCDCYRWICSVLCINLFSSSY